MRRLLRKELATTYLDPEVHSALQAVAKAERKAIREVLEVSVMQYIETRPTKPAGEAARRLPSKIVYEPQPA